MNLPKIGVGPITENEDGSAIVELDLDKEAVALLIQIGFEKLILDHLKETENV